jgi:hypothetical protein
MFPPAGSIVYHNEASEPLGWDAPDDIGPCDPFDGDDGYDGDIYHEDYDEDDDDDDE